jgi:spore coat polysaccharide biosynthesis protein SpsF
MRMSERRRRNQDHSRTGSFTPHRVMAFLQARMGSTRLPGKVLMRIQGRSILERAIMRLRAASVIDAVAVLTTCLTEDDVVAEEAQRRGVLVYRGSEQDVLARFYEAAVRFQPDIVVRATADNPLIEIGSIERVVDALRCKALDWCMEKDLPYGAATEALTADALAKVHFKAVEAKHREHVTLYIKEHPEVFRTSLLIPPDVLRHPQIRVTVDTPEDFLFVDQLICRLPEGGRPVALNQYLPFALRIMRERECKALALS